jgi:hypothetical protein
MKKQLVIIGIVTLLFCIGFSGCDSIGTTSIIDIQTHLNRYLNHTVTIKGSIVFGQITDGTGNYIRYLILDNVTKPTPFVDGTEYKFTGIVRYGEYQDTEPVIYLDVTKIETT